MQVDARFFMEFPFPLWAPLYESSLKGVYRIGGRGCKTFVCILFGFYFSGRYVVALGEKGEASKWRGWWWGWVN
jgi:hypothetical protein